jgi:serine/threonine protein kinase/tetratricopeptide (TPR) repeat protein
VNPNAPAVKAVFDRAHEIPSEAERQAYLDQACAGDPDLRQEVESLLRAHDAAGSFLETPAPPPPATGPSRAEDDPDSTGPYLPVNTPAEPSFASEAKTAPPRPADDAPPGEGPGARLGPYRLIEEIGHGGMGAVYLAEQEQPVRRRVALKIIKPGMDTEQVVARFEAERQALALMDHLNIAKVLDAGATPEGRPYFVMELVQGVPITRFCDDNYLTVRERLEVFVPVCQAIQHAHSKGLIHRDIKPSNVLVTRHEGEPFPKVIDFGIAKAIEQPLTDQSPETLVGTVVGTPEYMSPEQANLGAGGIDTRSDVYSLGVLLYEMLTGTTPIGHDRVRGTPLVDVLRLIVEEETPRPSTRVSRGTALPSRPDGSGEPSPSDKRQAAVADRRGTEPAKLARLLRGDLDWITMKALEKDRDRRYETAAGLARDVQRYLTDEPVEACPPSAGYRLGKLVRKHRVLATAVAGGVFMLLLVIVCLTIGLVMVNAARRQAERAEQRTHKALDITDALTDGLVRKRISYGPAEKEIMAAALADLQRFLSELGEAEEARPMAAATQARIANLARAIDKRADAEAGYRRAIALYERLAAEFPENAAYRKILARNHYNLGVLLEPTGNLAEAETALRRAVELHEQLAADRPADKDHRSDLAAALNDLGVVLWMRGQPAAAEEVYGRAIGIGNQLVAEFPQYPDYQANLGACYHNLGNVVRDRGQPAAALVPYGKAIELLTPLAAQEQVANARFFLRNAHWDRANALGLLGRHAEAVEDWQRAFDLDDKKADRDRIRLFQQTAREEEQLKAIAPGADATASGARLYAAAELFARAAEKADPDEKQLSMHYAGRALQLLEQARTAGYFRDPQRIEELKKDSSWKALRPRADFQKFVAGLDAGKGPK